MIDSSKYAEIEDEIMLDTVIEIKEEDAFKKYADMLENKNYLFKHVVIWEEENDAKISEVLYVFDSNSKLIFKFQNFMAKEELVDRFNEYQESITEGEEETTNEEQ